MAIHINLLHEQETLRTQRERDPLKLAMLGLLLVAMILGAWYFYRQSQVGALKAELARLKTEWSTREPQLAEAKELETEMASLIQVKTTLVERIEGRFFWAPILGVLQHRTPETIHITAFNGARQQNADYADITVTGLAAGAVPRQAAENFRSQLADALGKVCEVSSSRFTSLEDQTTSARVGEDTLPTAKFVIQMRVNAKPLEAPTPP